jgi:flagellar motor switch protein FliG
MSSYDIYDPKNGLTGPQRAAVILLALGEEHGRPIWDTLDEEEIKLISQEMLQLGTVQSAMVEKVLGQFATEASSANLRGGTEETRALLSRVLPRELVEDLIEQARGPGGGRTMYQKISEVSPEVVANYLKNEHPQTVAVVLSRVHNVTAAKVLALLPKRMGEDVACRILTMGQVPREILERIDQTLRTEFIASLARQRRRNPVEQLADILNNVGKDEEERFLQAIGVQEADAADQIRAQMFSFERLAILPPFTLQTILREAERADLVLALKGSPDEIRSLFFGNMTSRSARLIKAEMEGLGAVRLKQVDEAQSNMIALARRMERAGDIQLSFDQDGDELVT